MTFEEYDKAIEWLCGKLKVDIESGLTDIDSVYGVPRGGYYPAIKVAQSLGLSIVLNENEITPKTLVVDDICDSGRTLEKFSNNILAVVYKFDKNQTISVDYVGETLPKGWITIPDEKGTGIEENIRRIFEHIGEDPNRVGLVGTPDRMVRMWKEIYRGYDPSQKPKITTFPNGEDGLVYDNMVIDEGDYYSTCEHHMMPFFGHYWFAYIPNPKGRILGISKVGRVVDYCAAKMQVQERLTSEIVDMLTEALGNEYPPLGVALVMRGTHLCKTMRGVKKKGIMTSSYLTGVFKTDNDARAEFLRFVNNGEV